MLRALAILCCALLMGCQLSSTPAAEPEDPLTAAHQAEIAGPQQAQEPQQAQTEPAQTEPAEQSAPEPSAAPAPEVEAAPSAAAVPAALQPAVDGCEKRGGSLVRRASSGLYTCVRRTRDSGKACKAASDCDGVCLARSRTCAPAEPLLGCHDVLGRDGARSRVCLE